jgi:hypothetical protein
MVRLLAILLMFVFAFTTLCMADDEETQAPSDDFDKLMIKRNKKPKRQVVQEDEEPPPAPAKRAPARKQPPREIVEDQAAPAPEAGQDDAHFIQSDDYFAQTHALGDQAWIWVELSKAVTLPSSDTKGEGEFMKISNGKNYWTKHYWRTRIASKNELRLGMHMIAFNDNHRGEIYRAPDKKDRARGGGWFYAKITDMSDLYKGYVTVSGNYKVGLDNIRLILR